MARKLAAYFVGYFSQYDTAKLHTALRLAVKLTGFE